MIANYHVVVLSALSLLVTSPSARTQTPEAEKVRFTSCDGVILRGTYYPGQGREACPVLLLHELGEDDGIKSIKIFASALQKKGHAVLTFDFRGHGESTEVEADEFWSNRFANRALVRGYPDTEIAFKDFDPRYYPILVNDIAAAKAFLDRRHDDGECNSNNIAVIGFERGATLGALWVNSEFHRYEVFPPQFPNPLPQVASTSEGKKILCALWFSIEPKLGNRNVNLPSLIFTAGKTGALPMVFMVGDSDIAGKRIATQCDKALQGTKKLPYTGVTEVPETGDDRGAALLKKPATLSAVLEYVENVHREEAAERTPHNFRQTQYIWRHQRGFLSANRVGESVLNFNTYDAYLPLR